MLVAPAIRARACRGRAPRLTRAAAWCGVVWRGATWCAARVGSCERGLRLCSIEHMSAETPTLTVPERVWIEEEAPITSLCLSRDSRVALVNTASQEIHLWDLASQSLLRRYAGHCQGRFVSTRARHRRAHRHTAPSAEPGRPHASHQPAVCGRRRREGVTGAHTAHHGSHAAAARGRPWWCGCAAVRTAFGGADESFVVSGSEDSQVYVWHRHSGELLEVLPGHSGAVNAVAWSPNACLLASASDDHTVRVWAPPEGLQ